VEEDKSTRKENDLLPYEIDHYLRKWQSANNQKKSQSFQEINVRLKNHRQHQKRNQIVCQTYLKNADT
jgi:alpha-glucuronidase